MPKNSPTTSVYQGETNYTRLVFPNTFPPELQKHMDLIARELDHRLREINTRLNELEGGISSSADLSTDTTTLTFTKGILTDNS